MTDTINLWLDDMRPAPPGWVHARTDAEVRMYLRRGNVGHLSLDHDLGACEGCLGGKTEEQWLAEHSMTEMPNCDHFGTGYTLLCWMKESRCWPFERPTVHSLNPAGRARMEAVIERHYRRQALDEMVRLSEEMGLYDL